MIPHKTPVRHPYSGNRNVNITTPISREWQEITRLLPALLAEHLSVKDSGALHWIPRIHASRVSLQFLDLMQDIIWIDIDCSVNKIVGYVRGLPLLVGLKSEMLTSSELWFGASVNSLVTFIWSSGTSSVDFWEISQVPLLKVVVSTCNATLHSNVHTKLFYFTTKLQFNIHLTSYSHNNQKRSETKLRWSFREIINQNKLHVESYNRAGWKQRGFSWLTSVSGS
jgi:hypothetical protein